MNPAFQFLSDHKKFEPSVEDLVMKKVKWKYPNLTSNDLVAIFERGILGDYGKVYKIEPDVLMGWIEASQKAKNSATSYLSTGLVNPMTKMTDYGYPGGLDDWHKEANKCFTSFLSGVHEGCFHPHVYDRLVLDGKIQLNTCCKYLKDPKDSNDSEVMAAKQRVLKDFFLTARGDGKTYIYFIK